MTAWQVAYWRIYPPSYTHLQLVSPTIGADGAEQEKAHLLPCCDIHQPVVYRCLMLW